MGSCVANSQVLSWPAVMKHRTGFTAQWSGLLPAMLPAQQILSPKYLTLRSCRFTLFILVKFKWVYDYKIKWMAALNFLSNLAIHGKFDNCYLPRLDVTCHCTAMITCCCMGSPTLCSPQRHCNQPSVGFKSNLSACRKNWSTFSLLSGFWTSRQQGSQHDLVPQAHITDISRLPGFRQLHRISPSIDPWYYTPCIYIKRLSFHFFSSVSGMGSCRTSLWSRAKCEIFFWKISPQRKKYKNLERW